MPAGPAKRLAILQPAALHAVQVGDPAADGAYPTLVRTSLAGDLGPILLGPRGATIAWTTDPDRIPPDATVLLDAGAHISGWVHFGRGVYVGTGAVIINGHEGVPLTLGDGAVVGAGACVTRSVAAGTTVVGVPAKARG